MRSLRVDDICNKIDSDISREAKILRHIEKFLTAIIMWADNRSDANQCDGSNLSEKYSVCNTYALIFFAKETKIEGHILIKKAQKWCKNLKLLISKFK
jgi:hypothetical protein